jgi:hypothetical protein
MLTLSPRKALLVVLSLFAAFLFAALPTASVSAAPVGTTTTAKAKICTCHKVKHHRKHKCLKKKAKIKKVIALPTTTVINVINNITNTIVVQSPATHVAPPVVTPPVVTPPHEQCPPKARHKPKPERDCDRDSDKRSEDRS